MLPGRLEEAGVSYAFASNSFDASSMNSLGNMDSLSYLILLMSDIDSTSYGSSSWMIDELTQLHPHPFDAMDYENQLSMLITSLPVEHLQIMAVTSTAEQSQYTFKLQNFVSDSLPLNYYIPHM